jgi:hypothetical protein
LAKYYFPRNTTTSMDILDQRIYRIALEMLHRPT